MIWESAIRGKLERNREALLLIFLGDTKYRSRAFDEIARTLTEISLLVSVFCRRVSMFRRFSEQICQCCTEESPGHTASCNDYSSITETEEIRLSGDLRANHHAASRVPYVRQKLSEADKALLSLHVRTKSEEV